MKILPVAIPELEIDPVPSPNTAPLSPGLVFSKSI